jgi:hypothetical protein
MAVTRNGNKLFDERRHHLYSSDCMLRFTKSRRMRWGMLVAHSERKIIHSRVLMSNLKVRENLKGLDLDGMIILKFSLKNKIQGLGLIEGYLDQDTDHWKTLIVAVL